MSESAGVPDAIKSGDLEKLQQILRKEPGAAGARDEAGVSALMNARYRNRQDMVQALRDAGVELDIFEAAALGEDARVKQCLAGNPKLAQAWSADGFTALHFACFFGQESAARLLLAAGADSRAVAKNPTGVQPLHSAAAARQAGIARLMLDAGAEVNARQQGGWTALHSAANSGDAALAELLLGRGADASLANDQGKSAAAQAAEKGFAALAQRLERAARGGVKPAG
jgi:ankyrin repeat protein